MQQTILSEEEGGNILAVQKAWQEVLHLEEKLEQLLLEEQEEGAQDE